ncbi:MAG: NADH-quinone oxidoreductase subunit L, partial [Myxococcota bacterium]
VTGIEATLAGCSVVLGLLMFGVATWLYRDGKNPLPQKLLDNPSSILRGAHELVFNKYYVDEIYDWFIIRRARQVAQVLYGFDQKVIDGIVDGAGFVTRTFARIDGAIDALVVDGLVNLIGLGTTAIGRQVRRLQTGRIQTYLGGALVGALLLVLINFLLFE